MGCIPECGVGNGHGCALERRRGVGTVARLWKCLQATDSRLHQISTCLGGDGTLDKRACVSGVACGQREGRPRGSVTWGCQNNDHNPGSSKRQKPLSNFWDTRCHTAWRLRGGPFLVPRPLPALTPSAFLFCFVGGPLSLDSGPPSSSRVLCSQDRGLNPQWVGLQ